MLESESILSLPIEARWFYVTILLSADDVGLFEATSFKLARRADINRDIGEKLLCMLADNDLVRLYEVNGKHYGFIPRFRQRIQIKRIKHPAPPAALMIDDEDASSKINHLASNPTVGQQMPTVVQQNVTVAQPSEPEPEPEIEKDAYASKPKTPFPACPQREILGLYAKHLPHLGQPRIWEGNRAAMLRQRWLQAAKPSAYSPKGYRTKEQGLEWWDGFFGYIANQTKLAEGFESNGRSWRPDLEWIVTSGNFAKIIDGKYAK